MTYTPKPIETHYNGYRFRSRLEARWAVFFNMLDIRYEYEREGYELKDCTRYLPDFWLPEQKKFPQGDVYIEIKPKKMTDEERRKVALLAEPTRNVFVFIGNIPAIIDISSGGYNHGSNFNIEVYGGVRNEDDEFAFHPYDDEYAWCECKKCGAFGIQFNARSERIPCECKYDHKKQLLKEYHGNSHAILLAYQAARSARFEFNR